QLLALGVCLRDAFA
ncbi:DUF645 family protein, partial [Vibrio cholerae]|nr:DUF645 family protein [Vibrio cholerae]